MPTSSIRARLTEVLQPVVAAAGYDLEDVVVTPAGKRRLLRVIVDRDGGVRLDDVADLSRDASQALDDSDVMGSGPYVLEVTSPGVDRPLTELRHWRRADGRLVKAQLRDGTQRTGRVVDVTGSVVTLESDGARIALDHADIARGAVQVEFARSGAGHSDADHPDDYADDAASHDSARDRSEEEAPA